MAFRSSENLEKYERVKIILDDVIRAPANNQHQEKKGYKFTINDRSSFFDWYNACFEVRYKLEKLADGAGYAAADRITVINGSHSLIKQMKITSASKILYNSDNLHKVTFVKNLLEYSDDFSRTVGKRSFWYLDTNATTANTNIGFEARRLQTQAVRDNGAGGAKSISTIIPLNRFSFFEELEDKMLPPIQLQFDVTLQDDDELIHMANGADAGRVVVDRFSLFIPKMIPKLPLYDRFISSFLEPKQWSYLREMYNESPPTKVSGYFQITPSVENVKHVFVYLKRTDPPNNNNAEDSPYLMNTFKLNAADNASSLSTCKLEYGRSVFYPYLEYDAEEKALIFDDLMSYAMRLNDFNTGTQLNLANYNSLYPLIYFNLTYQSDKITRDPKPLTFHYKLTADATANFNVHAIVLYDQLIKIDKVGNELVIV